MLGYKGLSKGVFEWRTSTGTEMCALLLYLDAAKPVMLCCLALIESNCPKTKANRCHIAKCPLPVRRSLLKIDFALTPYKDLYPPTTQPIPRTA